MSKFQPVSLPVATALLVAAVPVFAVGVPGQGTWETTLQARDLDGDGSADAYYDTDLRITWLRDANFAATSGYPLHPDGAMPWSHANAWAAGLNINGVTGWRLPMVQPINGTSFQYFDWADYWTGTRDESLNIRSPQSELAHMFSVTLGNLSQYDTTGAVRPGTSGIEWGLSNTGPFANLINDVYWTGQEYEPAAYKDWAFHMYSGFQTSYPNNYPLLAWAVHGGDIAAVPEPSAVVLMLCGLGSLGFCLSRRNAQVGALRAKRPG